MDYSSTHNLPLSERGFNMMDDGFTFQSEENVLHMPVKLSKTIADRLNEEGRRTPEGEKFSPDVLYIPPALAESYDTVELIKHTVRIEFSLDPGRLRENLLLVTLRVDELKKGERLGQGGWHVDGHQGAERIQPDGEKVPIDRVYFISNKLPTQYTSLRVDLNPVRDFVTKHSLTLDQVNLQDVLEKTVIKAETAAKKKKQSIIKQGKENHLYYANPYVIHQSQANVCSKPIRRSFLRLLFSVDERDRIGDTINPLIGPCFPFKIKNIIDIIQLPSEVETSWMPYNPITVENNTNRDIACKYSSDVVAKCIYNDVIDDSGTSSFELYSGEPGEISKSADEISGIVSRHKSHLASLGTNPSFSKGRNAFELYNGRKGIKEWLRQESSSTLKAISHLVYPSSGDASKLDVLYHSLVASVLIEKHNMKGGNTSSNLSSDNDRRLQTELDKINTFLYTKFSPFMRYGSDKEKEADMNKSLQIISGNPSSVSLTDIQPRCLNGSTCNDRKTVSKVMYGDHVTRMQARANNTSEILHTFIVSDSLADGVCDHLPSCNCYNFLNVQNCIQQNDNIMELQKQYLFDIHSENDPGSSSAIKDAYMDLKVMSQELRGFKYRYLECKTNGYRPIDVLLPKILTGQASFQLAKL